MMSSASNAKAGSVPKRGWIGVSQAIGKSSRKNEKIGHDLQSTTLYVSDDCLSYQMCNFYPVALLALLGLIVKGWPL